MAVWTTKVYDLKSTIKVVNNTGNNISAGTINLWVVHIYQLLTLLWALFEHKTFLDNIWKSSDCQWKSRPVNIHSSISTKVLMAAAILWKWTQNRLASHWLVLSEHLKFFLPSTLVKQASQSIFLGQKMFYFAFSENHWTTVQNVDSTEEGNYMKQNTFNCKKKL